MMKDTQIDDVDDIPYDERRYVESAEHFTEGKIHSQHGGVKRWPNSPRSSVSTSPPLLSRAQAGVVASRPGAIRMAGLQQPSDLLNDEDSITSPTSARRSAQRHRDDEEEDVLVSAELVEPSRQEEPLNDITADVARAPAPASETVSSHPEIVHAEPLCEPQIGWKEILKNKTIGICLLVSFVVMAVITIIVVFAATGMKKQNDNGAAVVAPGVPPGVSPAVSPGIPPSPFRSPRPKGSGRGKH